MTVTPATPIRSIGDLPKATWQAELSKVNSPILAELDACIAAAHPHGALALVQSARESTYGTDHSRVPAAYHNPLGLMVAGSNPSQPIAFASWSAAYAEFARRLSNPAPPYDPQDISIKEYIRVYVGGPGCRPDTGWICANGENHTTTDAYMAATIADLNRLLSGTTPAPGPTGPTGPTAPTAPTGPSKPTFGNMPKPANFSVRLVTNSAAWNDLGQRIPRGIVLHRMLGTLDGTDMYFRGDGRTKGLTDFGVGLGKVYQWVDLNSRIAPWASGPADGLKGDAVAFVNRFGVNAINRDCAAVEIAGNYDDPVPAADWQRLVELVAWLADSWLRIPAAQWPTTNDGFEAIHFHQDFTSQKPCPGPVVMGRLAELETAVGQRLAQYQGGQPSAPKWTDFPGGFDDATIAALWPWLDPTGPISKYWLTNMAASGRYPDLVRQVDRAAAGKFYLFSDGSILKYDPATKTVSLAGAQQ